MYCCHSCNCEGWVRIVTHGEGKIQSKINAQSSLHSIESSTVGIGVQHQYKAQNWTNKVLNSSRLRPQCRELKSHIFWQFKHSHPTLHLILTSKAKAKSICTNSLTTTLIILLHTILSAQLGKNTNLTLSLRTPSWTYIGLIYADLLVLLFS